MTMKRLAAESSSAAPPSSAASPETSDDEQAAFRSSGGAKSVSPRPRPELVASGNTYVAVGWMSAGCLSGER